MLQSKGFRIQIKANLFIYQDRALALSSLCRPLTPPPQYQAPSPWNELIKGVFKNISRLHLHVLHH